MVSSNPSIEKISVSSLSRMSFNFCHHAFGLAEHPDIMETIEAELDKMSSYHDKLEMLDYFDISLNDKKLLND